MAKHSGADAVFHASEDIPAKFKELNDGRLADLVIVCTGAFKAFQTALKCVERAGTVLCFATTDPGVELPIPLNDFWRNGIRIMPSYANSPYDAEIAITLLKEKRVTVTDMITHKLPLAQTQEGFRLMSSPNEQAMKVIIEPQK
jgi:L-iditol 2-dehydrogenase